MKKEIYDMHDGIPIWKHLLNNSQEHQTKLRSNDYGKLAESIGKRELRNCIKFNNFLDNLFPNIIIMSIERKTKKSRRHLEYGDYCTEISYTKDGVYGKKVLIIEIKHGKVYISQQQIRRYSNYIINPSAYFRKADEVKVLFMIFTEIDTMNASSTYFLCEFNTEFANKIVDAIPKQEPDKNANIFASMDIM
mgnify:CR=1 FL=1